MLAAGSGSWLASGGMENGAYVQTTEIRREDGTWENGPNLEAVLHDHCQVQFGAKVFIAGGRGDNPSNATFVLEENSWRAVRSIIGAREFHACVEFLGKIFSIGGENNEPLTTVEIYDPETDMWEEGPELPRAVSKAQVINYQGTLYLVGGVINNQEESNTQVYTLSDAPGAGWETVDGILVDEQMPRVVFPAQVVNSYMMTAQASAGLPSRSRSRD